MLYKGTQEKYESQIADHAEHEDVLRKEGWLEYGELPESEPEMKYASGVGVSGRSKTQEADLSAFVPVEQFDELASSLVGAKSEIETLKGIIEKGMEENEQLRNRINQLESALSGSINDFSTANEKYVEMAKKAGNITLEYQKFKNDVEAMKARIAELQGDDTPVGTTSEAVDYNSLTADQLRALLDEKEIKYLARDNKDTLIALLTQPTKTEE
jgi:predicted  nucleic acid-binding Zn-ribbon protein